MSISTTYKELCCYKNMNVSHKEHFDLLAQYYGEILNQGAAKKKIIYTLHDFDHHCFDIYRTISLFLLRDPESLSEEEWYLLNLAVLFHDISMCVGGYDQDSKKHTSFDRNRHSVQSAEWIQHEFNDKKTHLGSCQGLDAQQVRIICDLCAAHSDVKGEGNPAEKNGLYNPALNNPTNGKTGAIRMKLLAGLLRIADELDITESRLGNYRTEEQFEEDDENDNESRNHWQRLHLFRDIVRDSENYELLLLQVNEGTLRERLDNGDAMNVVDDLEIVHEKVRHELDTLLTILRKDGKNAGVFVIHNVEINIIDEELRRKIDALKKEKLPPAIGEKTTHDGPASSTDNTEDNRIKTAEDPVIEIGGNIGTFLHRYVLDNNLLSVGHFQLNDEYCARDWLDTERIAANKELSKRITKALAEAIKIQICGMETSEYVIIGLGLVGTRQAAEVAFYMEMPFSYVIPAHQSKNFDTHEIKIPAVGAEKKIILITDCIVTGKTIRRIISDNKWTNNIIAAYSVFWRNPRNIPVTPLEGFPVYTLCKEFPAEISEVKKCPFGENMCKAPNRKQVSYNCSLLGK